MSKIKNIQPDAQGADVARKLISEDRSLLNEIQSDLASFKKPLQALVQSYEKLEIGSFTSEVYKEVIQPNGSEIVQERYRDELNRNLDKAGITNVNVRTPIVEAAQSVFKLFTIALSGLKQVQVDPYYMKRRDLLTLYDFSFIDGEFKFSDADVENILERYCRTYLENDIEHQAHGLLSSLISSLKSFFEFTDGLGLDDKIGGIHSLNDFLDENMEIKPDGIKWISRLIKLKEKTTKDQEVRKQKASLNPPTKVYSTADIPRLKEERLKKEQQERSDARRNQNNA